MRTTPAPAPSSAPTTRFEILDAGFLVPNPWNPNRMVASMYAKAIESIQTFGIIDPLTVRHYGSTYQIIDGEHRFRAGRDLGINEFPCFIIDGLSDVDAKKLTVVMNELHGQADPTKMGDLLNEILQDTSLEELLKAMPYDESMLGGFLGVDLVLPPLPPAPPAPAAEVEPKTKWVERLYKMPAEAALVLDEALEKAKDGDKMDNWQALERVAADYLAG